MEFVLAAIDFCETWDAPANATASRMKIPQRCGLQFSLQGPRAMRLGAIWVAEKNEVYFYDARGERYSKERLRHRLQVEREAA